MGDLVVSRNSGILTIIGLGSCVGVALYYSKGKIGGLSHVMLSNSTKSRPSANMDKYADIGLPKMLLAMQKIGAEPQSMTARLIGGANMFKSSAGVSVGGFNIGENNVTACREFCKTQKIRITGEEVLGNKGRTMRFDLNTGKISVRYVDGTILEL